MAFFFHPKSCSASSICTVTECYYIQLQPVYATSPRTCHIPHLCLSLGWLFIACGVRLCVSVIGDDKLRILCACFAIHRRTAVDVSENVSANDTDIPFSPIDNVMVYILLNTIYQPMKTCFYFDTDVGTSQSNDWHNNMNNKNQQNWGTCHPLLLEELLFWVKYLGWLRGQAMHISPNESRKYPERHWGQPTLPTLCYKYFCSKQEMDSRASHSTFCLHTTSQALILILLLF